ncbi:hydroxypyruvate isomerase family protein [Paracoccus onubensis]|uniref:hydroxypyruvate isomerase family protein n=1 Tax=Paracoccus onubensis TaxID=1675788 RepID=UPI001C720ED3|nr:TIM barrel protein [Paracoccus onubensis]
MVKAFPLSAHMGYLFTDLPLTDRVAAARDHGFAAVEYPAPYDIPARQMAGLLNAAGLRYTQFGLRSGNAANGEKGIGILPDRREEFRASLTEALDYAEAIGVRMLHAMSGILPAAERRPEHRACYIGNLRLAAAEAAKRDITIIIEPMSAAAVPDYFIDTPQDAAQIIAETGAGNIGLLLDIFHTAAIGQDIHQTIRDHAPLIRHVHIADYPGRHEPGSGELDFPAITATLAECGYEGVLGCEYAPAGETVAGLGWMGADWVGSGTKATG